MKLMITTLMSIYALSMTAALAAENLENAEQTKVPSAQPKPLQEAPKPFRGFSFLSIPSPHAEVLSEYINDQGARIKTTLTRNGDGSFQNSEKWHDDQLVESWKYGKNDKITQKYFYSPDGGITIGYVY